MAGRCRDFPENPRLDCTYEGWKLMWVSRMRLASEGWIAPMRDGNPKSFRLALSLPKVGLHL